MNKLAHAIVDEHGNGTLSDSEKQFMKEKKEEEIRMKLDAFANELAQMREKRKQR